MVEKDTTTETTDNSSKLDEFLAEDDLLVEPDSDSSSSDSSDSDSTDDDNLFSDLDLDDLNEDSDDDIDREHEQEDDNELNPDISREIAGYNPEMDDTLQQEDMLQMDEEESSERSFSEKGIIRALFVFGITGIIVLVCFLLWNVMFNRSPAPETAEEPEEEVTPFQQDETGRLKAQMAFNDQRRSVRDTQAQESSEPPEPEPNPQAQKQEQEDDSPQTQTSQTQTREPSTVSPSSSSARPRRTFSNLPDEPEPRPPSPPPPAPPESPPPTEPTRTGTVLSSPPPPPPPPEPEDIDPFARWNQLASLGQSRVSNGGDSEEEDTRDRNISAIGSEIGSEPMQTSGSTQIQPTEGIPTVIISQSSAVSPSPSPSSQPQFSSPGERGILLRRRVVDNSITSNRPLLGSQGNSGTRASGAYKQVPLGTTVPARVAIPMYWDEGGGTAIGQKYVIVLEEPLRSTSGEVALPRGTALITEIISVSSTRLVDQRVVAIAYQQEDGQVVQYEVNPDTFSIRGANNEPLIASGYFDPGGDIAKQDILISLLSSVGKVGEIINLPQTVSSSSASSGGRETTTSTSTTTTTRKNPDLLGAALQGFFQPLAESLRQRSQTQTQELLSRANIAVVPEGTPVSVVVESFLYVQ